ncbi:MAG: hypothetical protein RLZZ11_101, partial [Cyanobacteriota bacterium]
MLCDRFAGELGDQEFEIALAEKFGISEIVCDRWQIAQLAAE